MSETLSSVPEIPADQLNIVAYAASLREGVLESQRELLAAQSELADKTDSFRTELAKALQGKIVEVDGFTETAEVMMQDGFEWKKYTTRLEGARATVFHLSVEDKGRSSVCSPLVYLQLHDQGKNKVGVRLFNMSRFEIVSDELDTSVGEN